MKITGAEFAAAVEQLAVCAHRHDLDHRLVREARARVLALHADARNAGLRELRAWCEARQEWTTVLDSDHYVYMAVINKIDAMLKGGDGE